MITFLENILILDSKIVYNHKMNFVKKKQLNNHYEKNIWIELVKANHWMNG